MRTALITGASRGIGAAIAENLLSAGYQVLTPSRLELDLASDKSIDSYLSGLKDPIDILINNAGINHIAAFENIDRQDLVDTLQVNLLAPFHLSQFVAAHMKTQQYGRIVNISSILGTISRPGRTSYTMSKTGLNGMTQSLALELAPYNILVNAIAPGYVMTDLTYKNNSSADIEKINQSIPMQRLAEPAEIATVVAFLCSEQNTYLTGQTIVVDGGYTCQ